ncbi:Adenosine deaminase 2 [Holothuria leucospilota]|uniref:Adenosine deaminase 2 n=1 Tax=Holothuria leucospilota TaxID=206669 RepID=A0A9Q0YJ58_HOLLE|nr:Adenosine deaminase 2 [Holothuria leucospilota]
MEHDLASLALNPSRHSFGIIAQRCRVLLRILLLFIFVASATSVPPCAKKYCVRLSSRKIIKEENSLSFGGVPLGRKERLLQSSILAPMKAEELLTYDGISNNKSDLFQFIRKMPKGGDLHIHDISMVNIRWVISELTYLPNLYYCDTKGGKFVRYRYSDNAPEREDFCDDSWISVKERREEIGPEDFDKMLYDKMTMDNKYQGAQAAWNKFSGSIDCVGDLMYSESGFRPYFKQALTEAYEDNVLYVEVRTLMSPIVSNSGERFSREETLRRFIEVTNEFKEENPGFIGAKFIFLSVRQVWNNINQAHFPDLYAFSFIQARKDCQSLSV